VDTAWLAIEQWLAPRVLGRAFASPEEVGPELAVDLRGHEMARAAVEMGFWVLEAERSGVSLSHLLGGDRLRIATGISLGIQRDVPALIERVRSALAMGYRKIKVKIKPGRDLADLEAVRAAVGAEAPLMADANSAYRLEDAPHLAALDALGLIMIEQPLGHDDLVRHAALARRLATPICLDESITCLERAQDMVTLGSGRIVNIKAGRVAGLAAAKAIHDYCLEQRIPVWCGGMLETGIGRAANAALAALPGFTLPGDISASTRFYARDIVTEPITVVDGHVEVPTGPGLGFELDTDFLDSVTTAASTLTF
jgi:O-succinylbenzoate synthase